VSSHHFRFHSDDDDDDDKTVVSPIIIYIQPPSPSPSPSLLLSSSVMITTTMTIIRTRALLIHSDPSKANHRLIYRLNQQFLVFFTIIFTEFGMYREGGL